MKIPVGECSECGYNYSRLADLTEKEVLSFTEGSPDCITCDQWLRFYAERVYEHHIIRLRLETLGNYVERLKKSNDLLAAWWSVNRMEEALSDFPLSVVHTMGNVVAGARIVRTRIERFLEKGPE